METIKNKINNQNNEFVITKTQVSIRGQRNKVVHEVGSLGLEESEKPPFQLQGISKSESE
jgi:hypothetical protein